jgi:phage FluMu protein Com
MKTVKCQKCGTEYDMPNIGQEVIMEECPVCKELDATMKKLGL